MFLPAVALPMPRSDLSGKSKMPGKQLAGQRTQELIRFWQAQVTSQLTRQDMNLQLKALVKDQKTWRHPNGTWKGKTLVFPLEHIGHCASGSCPGMPRAPHRALSSQLPGRLDLGHVCTFQMRVSDFISGRDRHRRESVQGSGSERGKRGGEKRSSGRDAGRSGRRKAG